MLIPVRVFGDYLRNSKGFQQITNTTFTPALIQDGRHGKNSLITMQPNTYNAAGELGTSHFMANPDTEFI